MTPRDLPSVHAVLEDPTLIAASLRWGRQAVVAAVRGVLEDLREELLRGSSPPFSTGIVAAGAMRRLGTHTLRPVINATGILLHTGLGRAPLSEEALEAVRAAASGYCNLELDLERGERGRRSDVVERLLRERTGAEAAVVVNNNAAATVLALRALATGREVVVSRGQLVEIGGNFRLPEIFETSGARLKEVGTTNRTRLADYESAIGAETALFLRVHSSNFRIVGFTESVDIGPLAALAHRHGLLCIDDIGSGALGGEDEPAFTGEPTAGAAIAAGADVVLFSGDKLLGGPQCGIIIGRKEPIRRIESDPLMRAVRVDKMTLAALESTLRSHADPDLARRSLPVRSMLAVPVERLRERAELLASRIDAAAGWTVETIPTTAFLGGGSAPDQGLASWGVRIGPPFPCGMSHASELSARLRRGRPSVVARIEQGAVLLDLRSVVPGEMPGLLEAVAAAAGQGRPLPE